MILNELLTKQSILNALLVKDGNNELSKELKVKLVRLRIAYNKAKKYLDEDIQEFTKELVPEELKKLQEKPEAERTSEEKAKMEEMIAKVNSEYSEFMAQKGKEEVTLESNDSFTEEEFDEIVAVNAGNEVTINDTKLKAEDLMEGFYALFVDNK